MVKNLYIHQYWTKVLDEKIPGSDLFKVSRTEFEHHKSWHSGYDPTPGELNQLRRIKQRDTYRGQHDGWLVVRENASWGIVTWQFIAVNRPERPEEEYVNRVLAEIIK